MLIHEKIRGINTKAEKRRAFKKLRFQSHILLIIECKGQYKKRTFPPLQTGTVVGRCGLCPNLEFFKTASKNRGILGLRKNKKENKINYNLNEIVGLGSKIN